MLSFFFCCVLRLSVIGRSGNVGRGPSMRSAILWKTLFATTFRPAQERKNTNQMAELRVERGAGVAASPVLGLLVVCGENSDTLSVYDMRLSHVATFGGRYWGASGFNFKTYFFECSNRSAIKGTWCRSTRIKSQVRKSKIRCRGIAHGCAHHASSGIAGAYKDD